MFTAQLQKITSPANVSTALWCLVEDQLLIQHWTDKAQPQKMKSRLQWAWSIIISKNVTGENIVCSSWAALSWGPGSDLYRLDWKCLSDWDIWPSKWVQTICQASCHLEQLHFTNAGKRHCRFQLCDHGTRAAVMLVRPLPYSISPCLGYRKPKGKS